MSQQQYGRPDYGFNSQGNWYRSKGDGEAAGGSYYYNNGNGSYYYQNSNGSTYYKPTDGTGRYTAPRDNPRYYQGK